MDEENGYSASKEIIYSNMPWFYIDILPYPTCDGSPVCISWLFMAAHVGNKYKPISISLTGNAVFPENYIDNKIGANLSKQCRIALHNRLLSSDRKVIHYYKCIIQCDVHNTVCRYVLIFGKVQLKQDFKGPISTAAWSGNIAQFSRMPVTDSTCDMPIWPVTLTC